MLNRSAIPVTIQYDKNGLAVRSSYYQGWSTKLDTPLTDIEFIEDVITPTTIFMTALTAQLASEVGLSMDQIEVRGYLSRRQLRHHSYREERCKLATVLTA